MAGRSICRVLAFLFVVCLSLSPPGARADTVDVVVDALATSGTLAGIPIHPTEKDIVKSIIRDVVNDVPIVDALKNAVMAPLINQLPAETRNAANCLAAGVSPVECARRELPSAAACIAAGTDPATCAQRELLNRLPPPAREAIGCLATSAKVAECAQRHAQAAAATAIRTLENAAREQVDKHFKPAQSAIINLLNIVEGVQREDWQKVLENGGAAVAKAIIRETLGKLIPPLMPLAGPIIDAVVEHRIDLVSDLVNAGKNQDIPQATQVIIEAYLTMHIEMQCHLPLIPQVIRDGICGPLGDLIRGIGGAARGVTADVIELVKQIFDDPFSVPGEAWRRLTKESDCGTAERYYAQRFAMCYPAGVSLRVGGPPLGYDKDGKPVTYEKYEEALNGQCRLYFDRCFDSNDFDDICDPMRFLFREHTQKAQTAVTSAANGYLRELRHFIRSHQGEACTIAGTPIAQWIDFGYRRFVSECGSAVEKQVPFGAVNPQFYPVEEAMISPGVAAPNCVPAPGAPMTFNTSPLVGDRACERAISRETFTTAVAQVCRATGLAHQGPILERCKENETRAPDGRCVSTLVTIPPNMPIGASIGPCKEGETRVLGQCVSAGASDRPLKLDVPMGPIAAPGGGAASAGLFVDTPKLPQADCDGGRMAGGVCNCSFGEKPVTFANRTICMKAEGGPPQGTTIFPGGTVATGQPSSGGFDGTRCISNQVRGASGVCGCAAGTVWNGDRCVAGGSATSTRATPPSGGGFDGVVGPACPANLVRTMQGDCVCPRGMVWAGNDCRPGGTAVSRQPPSCPAGMLGTPPNCYHVPPASGGGFDMIQQALPGIVFGGRPTININPGGGRQPVNVNPGGNTPRSTGAPTRVQGTPRVGDAAGPGGPRIPGPVPLPTGPLQPTGPSLQGGAN